MPGVRDNMEFRFWPGAMKIPRTHHRTYHVVPPLNDNGGNMANEAYVVGQVVLPAEESIVHEIVALDSGKRKCLIHFGVMVNQLLIGYQLQRAGFPTAPHLSRKEAHGFIVAGEPAVIGFYHIASLGFRDRVDV